VRTTLFLEHDEVLQRPENRFATGMSAQDIERFLAAFASAAHLPVETPRVGERRSLAIC
jgi:hypothetical protein